MMRILTTLYYYRPHYSGLTVYTERLARALARRGHQVTVLTSRYDPQLPPREVQDGVVIRRLPVAVRLSKGVVMPAAAYWGPRLALSHDVVHVHVPQLDAAPLAVFARLAGRPVVMTYHCDLHLPPTPVNWLADRASRLADTMTAAAADVVVANTYDYAVATPVLRRHLSKLVVAPPPVDMPEVDPELVRQLRRRLDVKAGDRLIGMAARLASEKGVEILVQAMPSILAEVPGARVVYVGQHLDVLGEQAYARRLAPLIAALGRRWVFLGSLSPGEMAAFYAICDVTVLPSLNSTESFGMVQVESMLCGTPAVASDLPGVREPTLATGMGLRAPPGDPAGLAEAIVCVLRSPGEYDRPRKQIATWFSSDRAAQQYEEIFASLLRRRRVVSR